MHPLGRYALALAARGLRVFPISVDSPDKSKEEIKKPPEWMTSWQKKATANQRQIERWWRQADWNIGVATGPGGNIVVLDYDMKPGQEGAKSLWIHETIYNLPHSYRVRTPSGGVHVYLRLPPGVFVANSVSKLAPNCDIRGNASGGYVLGEGSTIHGTLYYRI